MVLSGGSSGLGEALLTTIGRLNVDLTLCNLSRTPPRALEGVRRGVHLACDLTDSQQVEAACEELSEMCKKLSTAGPVILVNNAGYGWYGNFPSPGEEHLAQMVDLNARAPLVLTHRMWPWLVASGGAVVNVCSLAGYMPSPRLGVYAATKAFLLNWSLALREEARPQGVRVLAVCPGPTASQFYKRAGFAERPVGRGWGPSAEGVARAAWRALEHDRAVCLPGGVYRLAAWASQLLPPFWRAKAVGRVFRWSGLPEK